MSLRIFFVLCLVFLTACTAQPERLRPETFAGPPLTFDLPEVERLVLPNGIRLYLKQDHELPLVQATAMIGAGSIGEPAEKTGLAQLYASLLRTGGAGTLSPAEFDAKLERLAVNLSVAADTYATTGNISMQASDLKKGLSLLADLLRRPQLDPQRLELARRQLVEQIRRQDDDPGFVASRTLHRAVYGDHPLGWIPTIESVREVTREDLRAFHERFVHPNNLWLAISGDFDQDRLLDLLQNLFGDWPTQDFIPQQIPPLPEAPPPAVYPVVRDLPQTTILLGERGIDKSNPDLYPLKVMNFILGGGGFNSRLMREVRSNRGLAYSVYSYFDIGRRLPGLFVTGSETKTASVEQVVEIMQQQMREITETPVSAAELELAKESLINSFVFAFEDPHDIVNQTMRLDFYDYPSDYLERYREQLAEVTAEQVLAAARKHLNPEEQVVVLVGEETDLDQPLEKLERPVATPATP